MTQTKTTRVTPLDDAEWSEEQRELLTRGKGRRVLNVSRTIARHLELYRSWAPFAAHVLFKSTLDARSRELLILRTGHLCDAAYEVHHHTALARRAGLTDEEIERVRTGADAPGWAPSERALLAAADELHEDTRISDGTWQMLAEHFDTKGLLDVVFTVGQYTLVSMALNSLGVQIEPE